MAECMMSTKNHCMVDVCSGKFLVSDEDNSFIEIKSMAVPNIVTINGIPFSNGSTLNEGASITKVEKNHPAIIVPADRRSSAFFKFSFSSPIGDRGFTEGKSIKQKKTIRKL